MLPDLEIDVTFGSYDEWLKWAESNPEIFSRDLSDEFADQITCAGFVEPLTKRRMTPSNIAESNRNWREGLRACGISSRNRAVLYVIEDKLERLGCHEVRVFATEALTPFALLLRGTFARFIGSEYGESELIRRQLYPIPHQDLCALSLPSDTFDLVTTNEVLEHIPSIDTGLQEISRVLKRGGWHVGTHPFRFMNVDGDIRAQILGGQVIHLKDPEYHGNPVDPAGGSLVFETPGWDIIERAKSAGFKVSHMRFIASATAGILSENLGVFVLCLQK